MRHLPGTDVPASIQSVADFEIFARKDAAGDETPEKAKAESIALAKIGFLAEPVDLLEASITAAVSQAAAYYSPKGKAFFVVQLPEDDAQFDLVTSHELTHALQDQHFNLTKLMEDKNLNDDAANARRFLVEGDATVVMMAYLMNKQLGSDVLHSDKLPMLRGQFEMMASLDPAQMISMMGGAAKGTPQAAAADAAAKLPPYVLVPMFDSYMKGARAVLAAFIAGDWAGVDALYTKLPTSTEQMLHPAEKLVCHRDEPVAIALPKSVGKGWKQIADGVAGELGMRIYGSLWKLPDPAKFAAGWGGDHWVAYSHGEESIGLLETAWDSADDAKEFADGMTASFATRKVTGDVEIHGDRVDVVIGCDGAACKPFTAAMAKANVGKVTKAAQLTTTETACLAKFK